MRHVLFQTVSTLDSFVAGNVVGELLCVLATHRLQPSVIRSRNLGMV